VKLARAGPSCYRVAPVYNKPETIDDLVEGITARILGASRIEQDLVKEWKA